jgi:2-keto-4-pentenoate hydratase/2-oxohepta-3-ene-1,7-dioic acid hydratase in catechol pathway
MVGVVVGEGVCQIASGTVHSLMQDPDWLAQIPSDPVAEIELSTVRFRPLLGETGRVFAAGLNYNKVYPAGKQPPTPKFPPWFSKLPGTLVGHNEPVVAPQVSETFDYEAELAAVIGVGGRHISVDTALSHVAAWTCMNDGSVRAWQRHSVNAGKNFERSGSIGPWMVTADEIADPQNLRLMARVDGEVRQDASTSEMIFSVAEIISYLSQSIELRPGDVIATGSPEGTGGSFDPPRFLQAGQKLEIEVEGIGVLSNDVIAEANP